MADPETVPVPATTRPAKAFKDPGYGFLDIRWRLPSQCEVCRSGCHSSLCGDCITRFAAPVPRCLRCGLRLGIPAAACGDCQRSPPPFTRTVCVADYGFPWDRLITAFKFEDQPSLARGLAPLLAQRLQDDAAGAALPAVQLVMPIPLSPQRLAERGYNQAWELACRVARLRGLPACADLLQRPVATAHQADLGRTERQANLRRAFMVDPRRRATLAGLHVALVDDVMTTGATLREAAAVLLRAGAATVQAWVLVRTPDE
ncbi:MAG: ComF family protein [Rubrivivax sp.]|nr:ComF family protein [Rubrivivax sp.]